jgi:hypothetical protein
VASGLTVAAVRRYTCGYTLPVGDSGCSASGTHMDTRGQCGDSGCSAGCTLIDTRGQWVTVAAVLRYTYGYTWPVWLQWLQCCDTHMDTRGQWVTVVAVLRYTFGYTWLVGDSG